MKKNNIKKGKKQNIKTTSKNSTTSAIPIIYPDARYSKTNVAHPSLENVIREKEWVEYDKL